MLNRQDANAMFTELEEAADAYLKLKGVAKNGTQYGTYCDGISWMDEDAVHFHTEETWPMGGYERGEIAISWDFIEADADTRSMLVNAEQAVAEAEKTIKDEAKAEEARQKELRLLEELKARHEG